VSGKIIWGCDYCFLTYYEANAEHKASLTFTATMGREADPFITLPSDEFDGYEIDSEEDALNTGLDILSLHDVDIYFDGQSLSEDLQWKFGSSNEWLEVLMKRLEKTI